MAKYGIRKALVFVLAPLVILSMTANGNTYDVDVIQSYAACKDPAVVEKFEDLEKADDDQGYKRLWFSTGASKECIFLRRGEIVRTFGEVNGRFTCIFSDDPEFGGNDVPPVCYWTATTALKKRSSP